MALFAPLSYKLSSIISIEETKVVIDLLKICQDSVKFSPVPLVNNGDETIF